MSTFGNLLRSIREEKNLSRVQLAEGICSEKYIYLIEKGERTPSATILRQFSQVLQTDLFRYYRFIDFEDTVEVTRILNGFVRAIRTSDYNLRGKIVAEAEQLEVFKRPPLNYVLIGNRAMYKLTVKEDYDSAYFELKDIVEEIIPRYAETIYATTLYLAFSYTLNYFDKYEESYQYALKAESIHKDSLGFYYGADIYYLAESRATILHNLYRLEKYQEAVDYGQSLIENFLALGIYARLEIALGYLAFSFYRLNRIEEAVETLRKAIKILLLTRNQIFLKYLLAEEDFNAIRQEFPLGDYILKEFDLFLKEQSMN